MLKISLACVLVFTGSFLNGFAPTDARIQKSNPEYDIVDVCESTYREVVIGFIVSSIKNNFRLLSPRHRHQRPIVFGMGANGYNGPGWQANHKNMYGSYMIVMVSDITCLIDNDIPP